ncbi:S1C family serine protease [Lichenihabitans sp. Uapishka_5]|uniref:S1C family serine protease n=1 Tax=Lichenihabitans sp. Uapishka_5 TaxID=3037302 RepID=UPI0029E7E956|nr:S1C family serine protease [Lichenihabitans sp. Uapishka_5]MDX7950641.1 S1C family serine protease [Lichenihabitans sp. Uapishka_5]
MSDDDEWSVPPEARPRPRDYDFDLDEALTSVVALEAEIPEDAFTAGMLGTERAGSGVLIKDTGIVVTIGYLITEAREVTLMTGKGQIVAGHVLGIDQATGLGLVQALEPLDIPAIAIGDSRHVAAGDKVVVAGASGRRRSLAAQVVARQEFAGYWEYLIEEAIFTAPAHPNWGGTALIGPDGKLVGVGSLQLQHQSRGGAVQPLNMMVPTELLLPAYDALLTGRPPKPARPWLGVFAQEHDNAVMILDVTDGGPAKRAGLKRGDLIRKAGDMELTNLADFYRSVWAVGPAGVDVALTIERDGDAFDLRVTSANRQSLLKRPTTH